MARNKYDNRSCDVLGHLACGWRLVYVVNRQSLFMAARCAGTDKLRETSCHFWFLFQKSGQDGRPGGRDAPYYNIIKGIVFSSVHFSGRRAHPSRTSHVLSRILRRSFSRILHMFSLEPYPCWLSHAKIKRQEVTFSCLIQTGESFS